MERIGVEGEEKMDEGGGDSGGDSDGENRRRFDEKSKGWFSSGGVRNDEVLKDDTTGVFGDTKDSISLQEGSNLKTGQRTILSAYPYMTPLDRRWIQVGLAFGAFGVVLLSVKD